MRDEVPHSKRVRIGAREEKSREAREYIKLRNSCVIYRAKPEHYLIMARSLTPPIKITHKHKTNHFPKARGEKQT